MASVEVQLATRETNAKWFVGVCGALLTAIGTVLTVLKPLKTYEAVTYPGLLLIVLAACLLSYLASMIAFALCVHYRANLELMRRFYGTGTILFICAGVALTGVSLLVVMLPSTPVFEVVVPTLSIAPEEAVRFPITITSSQRQAYAVSLEVIDPARGVALTFPPSAPGLPRAAAARAMVPPSTSTTLIAMIWVQDGEPPTRVLGRVVVAEPTGSRLKDKVFEITVRPTVHMLTYDVTAEARVMTAVTFFATANFSGPAEVEVYGAEPLKVQVTGRTTPSGPKGLITLVRGQPVAIPIVVAGGAAAGDTRAVVVVRNRHGLLSTSEFRVMGRKS